MLLGLGLAVEDDIANRRTLHDDEAEHEHDDFASFVVELPAAARPEELAARVAAATGAANVLRVKGFAEVGGQADAAPGAGGRAAGDATTTTGPGAPGEPRATRLVVIGLRGLDRAEVERILAA